MRCDAKERWLAAILGGAVATGLTATFASAAPPPKAPPSAIAQYQEAVPTSTGPVRATGGGSATLSPAVVHSISANGGPDAKTLERVAGDTKLGAPRPKTAPQAATHTEANPTVAPKTRRSAAASGHNWIDASSRWTLARVGFVLLAVAAAATLIRRART